MKDYVFASGYRGETSPMNRGDSECYLKCIVLEKQDKYVRIHGSKDLLCRQVIESKIDSFDLPISFTDLAYLAMISLTRVPGGYAAILIDALNMFEGSEVTVEMLSDLYPYGFYSQDSFRILIDEYLKPRKVKWSEIY